MLCLYRSFNVQYEKNVDKGRDTNLYKTRIKPRKLKRYVTRKSNNDRGGGLFKFISNGLKHIAKKAPASLPKLTKKRYLKVLQLQRNNFRKKVFRKL